MTFRAFFLGASTLGSNRLWQRPNQDSIAKNDLCERSEIISLAYGHGYIMLALWFAHARLFVVLDFAWFAISVLVLILVLFLANNTTVRDREVDYQRVWGDDWPVHDQ